VSKPFESFCKRAGVVSEKQVSGKYVKTKKKLDKGKEARRLARKAAARPASTKVVQDKRMRPEKHKKRWIEVE
jgi:hypothetical protein